MNTYRVRTSELYWRNRSVKYYIDTIFKKVKALGHRKSAEIVFEAEDDVSANKIFSFYVERAEKGGRFTASLQRVKIQGGVVIRIRTIKTAGARR